MKSNRIRPIFSLTASSFHEFSPLLQVATSFIEHHDQLLVLKRSDSSLQAGKWCIPGGKLELGETPFQAIAREVFEEVSWLIPQEQFMYEHEVFERISTRGDYILHLFRLFASSPPLSVKILPSEHSEYKWVTHDEFKHIDLIPGQIELYEFIYGEKNEPRLRHALLPKERADLLFASHCYQRFLQTPLA